MIKKFVFGSYLAFLLFYGDCWGMKYTENLENASSTLTSQTRIKEAVCKWSHLVPAGDVKSEIDVLIPQILESRQKMEQLVTLVCNPSNSSEFANYAHMVFTAVFPDYSDEERNKFGGMLSTIAGHRSSGGGTHPDVYWTWYNAGYFNTFAPEDDDSEWGLKK